MKNTISTILVMITAYSLGCFELNARGSGPPNEESIGIKTFIGNSENCFLRAPGTEAQESAIVAVLLGLAPTALKVGLPTLGEYFTGLAEKSSTEQFVDVSSVDQFEFELADNNFRVSSNLKCLTIVVGPRGNLNAERLPSWLLNTKRIQRLDPKGRFVSLHDGKPNISVLQALGLVDIPLSYFEFRFERDLTNEAMRLVPNAVYHRQSLSKEGESEEARDIEITVTVVSPSPSGSLSPAESKGLGLVAQMPLVFKGLDRNLDPLSPVRNFRTVWVSAPSLPNSENRKKVKTYMAAEGIRLLSAAPANVYTTLREVGEENLILHHLGKILSNKSLPDDLANMISSKKK